MNQAVRIGITVASVALVAAPLLWMVVTDGPPANFTLRNRLGDATCAVAFGDGSTWNVSIRSGEDKHRLFLFGLPKSASANCRVGGESIIVTKAISDFTGCRIDPSYLIIRRAGPSPGAEMADAYCIVS